MNRKRIALLTSLAILTNTAVTTNNHLLNAETRQNKAKSNASAAKYPDISEKLDLTSMQQYTSVSLFMNVTLNDFYVKDTAVDDNGYYILLLAPIKSSDQYFLVTTKSKRNVKINQKINIQGFLNGKIKINTIQVNNGINKKYLNKVAVSMLADDLDF